MHELGFEVVTKKKRMFVDGHEHDDVVEYQKKFLRDVVEYQKKFLRRMLSLGFLNPDNAPTDEAKAALLTDITSPFSDIIDKTV